MLVATGCKSYQGAYYANDPFNRVRMTFVKVKPGDKVRIRMKNGSKFRGMVVATDPAYLNIITKKPKDQSAVLYYDEIRSIEKSQLSIGKTAMLISAVVAVGSLLGSPVTL